MQAVRKGWCTWSPRADAGSTTDVGGSDGGEDAGGCVPSFALRPETPHVDMSGVRLTSD